AQQSGRKPPGGPPFPDPPLMPKNARREEPAPGHFVTSAFNASNCSGVVINRIGTPFATSFAWSGVSVPPLDFQSTIKTVVPQQSRQSTTLFKTTTTKPKDSA